MIAAVDVDERSLTYHIVPAEIFLETWAKQPSIDYPWFRKALRGSSVLSEQ